MSEIVPIVPDELPYRIYQIRYDNAEVESLIACFQHDSAAVQFVRDYRAITGHFLSIVKSL